MSSGDRAGNIQQLWQTYRPWGKDDYVGQRRLYLSYKLSLHRLMQIISKTIRLLKKRPANTRVIYLFSLIYLHQRVSAVIQPSSGLWILKITISYNVCIRPRYFFFKICYPILKLSCCVLKNEKVMLKISYLAAIQCTHTRLCNFF
jgi:hypothetical protein